MTVGLCVCLLAYLKDHTSKHPPLTTMQYDISFVFGEDDTMFAHNPPGRDDASMVYTESNSQVVSTKGKV